MRGHEDRIWSIAFSSDGEWLATGGFDTSGRVWNVHRMCPTDVPGRGDEGETTAAEDGTAALTLDATAAARVLEGRAGRIKCLCFGPAIRRWLASGSDQGVIKVSVCLYVNYL